MTNTVYLLLGSNLGHKAEYLKTANSEINLRIGNILRASSIYESEAWGFENDNSFFNQVIEVSTKKTPRVILTEIHKIEAEMGRIRSATGYSSRIIDIDILYYSRCIVNEPDLIIPHKHLHNRRFTLVPLVELVPDFVHPFLEQTSANLLKICTDKSLVIKIQQVGY